MTSREHARRLMLILLSTAQGESGPEGGAGASRDERDGGDAQADGQEGTAPGDAIPSGRARVARRGMALAGGVAGM